MPYLFTCPHCQTKTQVEDRYSGQSGECAVCGEAILIPSFASATNPGAIETPSGQVPSATSPLTWFTAAGVLLILLACLFFLAIRYGGRTIGQLNVNRQRTSSMKNLERIASALNAYAADHGTYPPPMTRDDKGKALHSWRVLILPYLDEDTLYNKFDLNSSWDAPQNMGVATRNPIPQAYMHPNAGSSGSTNDSGYYLITGNGTLFPPAGPLGPNDVGDDPASTLLVVEGAPMTTSIAWTEPIDLDFASMQGKINAMTGLEPGGLTAGGAALATVDGRAHFAKESLSPNIVRSLITPNGGEPLRDDALD